MTGTDSNHCAAPVAVVLLSMVIQNIGAAWAKTIFPVVGAEGVTAIRVGSAALIMLAIRRPWRGRIARGAVPVLMGYGIALGGMNLCIYLAIARIPIGIAVAIEVAGPLAVVVAASRSGRDLIWPALAVLGLAMLLPIAPGNVRLDPVGVACAVAAGVCWAAYIVLGKALSASDGMLAVSWGLVVAASFTVPVGLARAGTTLLAPVVLLAGVGVAILSSALPYSLEMAAMRRLPWRIFGILVSASPAISAMVGFVFLGERIGWVQGGGIAVVALASAGCAARAGRTPPAVRAVP